MFERESALPLSIVMAVDTSLSTRKDLPLEVASARRFARTILRPIDALSLYQFSETVSELVPFTPDLRQIDRGLRQLHPQWRCYGSLRCAVSRIPKFISAQATKVIVVITDGGDTASRVAYKEALDAAQEAEAIVYSIIIVPIEASAGREQQAVNTP